MSIIIDDIQVACDAKIVITEAIIYASILTIVAFTGERSTLSPFLSLSAVSSACSWGKLFDVTHTTRFALFQFNISFKSSQPLRQCLKKTSHTKFSTTKYQRNHQVSLCKTYHVYRYQYVLQPHVFYI